MPLTIPSTLKLAQLKKLAFKCGILTSGTKSTLIQRLQNEIAGSEDVSSKAGKKVRILSIDMGIRNLAYCILDVPAQSVIRPGFGAGKGKDGKAALPSILAWHRLAVSSPPVAIPTTDTDGITTTIPAVKEAFDPATLSQTAYTLLRTQLLPKKPTHILIERQRFRSMGSSHILEWTVRVNMFESILYAVLCTLKAEGLWEGSVRSVLPGKVGPFWVGEEEEGGGGGKEVDGKGKGRKKVRKSTNAKTNNKGAKIDLVRSWLENGDVVGLGNDGVKEMARRYVEKWDRVPGGRKKVVKGLDGEVEEKMGKLDDLADCLLQVLPGNGLDAIKLISQWDQEANDEESKARNWILA
ncbi:mitochondrial putative cruciform cutting endonuclease 1 [Rhexocercosporidium sp. MPI-PUGE-AT-0058]|nr:mitochondrial putative cruciform cutting endonuclease 1 [Rhexocercosporidium sp. MPI-PUGE-AT-0058]